ncbi:MAG: class I SAM-dependent methyltransferase [Proteobacteria bacterium]|nr:class I SAM-dependent methyltransferase [Pseudomonadota bacterium]
MDQQIVPALEDVLWTRSNRWPDALPCKICGGTSPFFDLVDFNKCCLADDPYTLGPSCVGVPYYRCDHCRFAFTTFFDDWDDSLFRRYIYNDRYIQVDPDYAEARPTETAAALRTMLRGFEGLTLLDYGSGSGVLAAQLRDAGFASAAAYDPFSQPNRPNQRFDVVTCFETIEHAPHPHSFIRDLASLLTADGCIILGTSLQPDGFDLVRGSWWYVAPRNGHVSIYSTEALSELAAQQGLVVHGQAAPFVLTSRQPRPDIARLLCQIMPPPQAPIEPEEVVDASTSVKRELRETVKAAGRLAVAAQASLVWRVGRTFRPGRTAGAGGYRSPSAGRKDPHDKKRAQN